MPWWVRAWSRPPLRAIGRFEGWLWDHGGYDVEGPEAVAERERLTARDQALDAVLEAALDDGGPWPTGTSVRTQNVEVIDVDRYEDLAVVTAAIAHYSSDDGPLLVEKVFRWEDGGWRSLGGLGSGSGSDPLIVRREWRDPEHALQLSGLGWNGPGGKRRPRVVCHATLLCSPAVSSVIVERTAGRRHADVSKGAGWIGIVWPQGSEPTVTALDAAGDQIGVLEPDEFRCNDQRHVRLFRGWREPLGALATWRQREARIWWRPSARGSRWFNYEPRKRQGD